MGLKQDFRSMRQRKKKEEQKKKLCFFTKGRPSNTGTWPYRTPSIKGEKLVKIIKKNRINKTNL